MTRQAPQHLNAARANFATARPVILLTGFGPFPGVPENVSGSLVMALASAATPAFPDFDVRFEILATEWEQAPARVTELIIALSPVLSLHFGVAKTASDIRLETRAANLCHGTADAAGLTPLSNRLVPNGDDLHAATIPISALYQTLAANGFPVSISDDAGGYLCNAVLYHSVLENNRQGRAGMSGFIHLPADLKSPPVTFSVALNVCLHVIGGCLAVEPV
jgi:pyroglutamyl-peptidase